MIEKPILVRFWSYAHLLLENFDKCLVLTNRMNNVKLVNTIAKILQFREIWMYLKSCLNSGSAGNKTKNKITIEQTVLRLPENGVAQHPPVAHFVEIDHPGSTLRCL